jgi:hypothetical protein
MIRLKDEKEKEIFPYLNRIEKSLREQGFSTKRAEAEDIKRILAVYFEQYTCFKEKNWNSTLARFANRHKATPQITEYPRVMPLYNPSHIWSVVG